MQEHQRYVHLASLSDGLPDFLRSTAVHSMANSCLSKYKNIVVNLCLVLLPFEVHHHYQHCVCVDLRLIIIVIDATLWPSRSLLFNVCAL